MSIIKQEQAGSVFGVPGRFFAVTVYGDDQTIERCRGRIASQKFVSESRPIDGYGTNGQIKVTIRYDDDCENGHESFTIAASVTTRESLRRNDIAAGGCLHDDIAQVFPELEPLIKWHHMNSDGPWGYIGNTVYFAGDRDCWGKRKGEIKSYATTLQFGNFPITYTPKKSFFEFLRDAETINNDLDLQIVPVEYVPRKGSQDYKFGPKFSFSGMLPVDWYSAPFDTKQDAEQVAQAIRDHGFKFVEIPNAWGEGKDREFDKARSSAIWPDATDEQLSLEKSELTTLLEQRLPGLIAEFKTVIANIGFLFKDTQK